VATSVADAADPPIHALLFKPWINGVSADEPKMQVQRYDADQVTVLFDEHGYRDLYLPVVLEHGLLRLAGDGGPAS